ncbi:very short patch repair endonuclease [Phenylobacterium hankyongense]|uniref:Very short patch repair endonuclease n=1 Tax=Phenylobacterium hankyongense TaxID=1813876 RepID=A0A328AYU0_9CAUL|nr:very short patch repair endonuclease [Phenylobacterium hankyongense]RAK59465.1 very short patch repair endonuclease [Phenylobacterium hankyongense]
MVDRVTTAQRSANMARVANKNTGPEMAVRRRLHASGFRFSLHRRDLPGRPDIALPAYRAAVFVHGCFWHGHECTRGRRPQTNTAFWDQKIDRNIARDAAAKIQLEALGWEVHTVWTCCLADGTAGLIVRLSALREQRRRPP